MNTIITRTKKSNYYKSGFFPDNQNVSPRYDQISLNVQDRKNKLQQILSQDPKDEGVRIHQEAWFHLGEFDKDYKTSYTLKKEGNVIFIFVLNGSFTVNNEELSDRDGYGMWDLNQFDLIKRPQHLYTGIHR